MSTPTGWLVVQRNLTGSVQVREAPGIWFTAVFSTPSRKIAGGNADSTAHGSLVGAVRQAIHAPTRGAPSSGLPAVVVACPGLVDEVRGVLRAEGIGAAVDEVATPDWAEDVLTELVGHLAGRIQVVDPPTPEEWAVLHQQAATYAAARPWERLADDTHLALELRIGSSRSDAVAIVLGNAGLTRGLALSPGRAVPEALASGSEEVTLPPGTVTFSLIERAEAPPEMLERAGRYGWPTTVDAPLFAAIGPDGPQEIGQEQAMMLTVALAAATDRDRQGAGFGMQVRGQMVLANGRRGRWRAVLEPNVPLSVPPGLRLLSGEIRHDLIPEGTVVGLGGLPWEELETVRRAADRHLSHREKSPAGDALPVLILGMERAAGERVARELDAARPEGVALIDVGPAVLMVIITNGGMHGVADLPADEVSLARYRLRLDATEGWHGIIVSTPTGERRDPIFAFFECVLAQAPTAGIGTVRRGVSTRRSRGRKPRRGR